MSGNQAWRNWLIIVGLLVVFALITAVWSGLVGRIALPTLAAESTSSIPVETENIDLEILPIQVTMDLLGLIKFDSTLFRGYRLEGINPYVAIGGMFGLSVLLIGAVAAPIALLFIFGSRQVEHVVESETYKESEARLAAKEKEENKRLNEGREIKSEPHIRPRWSAISTGLIILMFAWFAALVINGTVFPEGEFITPDGTLINTTSIFVWSIVGVTLLALLAWVRPQSILTSEKTDYGTIPWDTIAVIMTGLIVVGLGIGAMIYIIGPLGG